MTRFSVYSLYISQMHGSHAWVTCISLRACISLPRAHTSVELDSEAPSQQSKTRALDYMGKRSGPTAGACYEKANASRTKTHKTQGPASWRNKKEIAMPSSGVQRGGEVEWSIGVARDDTRAWAHAVSSGCPLGDETFALGKGGPKG